MITYARYAHAAFAWLFVLALVVQVFLAGMFNFGSADFRKVHIEFGYTWVGLAAFALLVSALVARPGRRHLGWVTAALVLYIVQTSLPAFRATSVPVAALHPVNALILFAVALVVARRAMANAQARTGELAAPDGGAR